MPHLVQMDKKYREKGLRILAPEVQGSSKEQIEAFVEKHKIDFPIMADTERPAGMRGIPHALVFDANGDKAFQGHPGDPEFEKTIKAALKDVKVAAEDDIVAKDEPLIPERKWTNTEGKTVTAAILSVDGATVKMKLPNGKETNYPIEKLSETDQEIIKDAAGEEEDE